MVCGTEVGHLVIYVERAASGMAQQFDPGKTVCAQLIHAKFDGSRGWKPGSAFALSSALQTSLKRRRSFGGLTILHTMYVTKLSQSTLTEQEMHALEACFLQYSCVGDTAMLRPGWDGGSEKGSFPGGSPVWRKSTRFHWHIARNWRRTPDKR